MTMDIDVREDDGTMIVSSAEQHHTLMTLLKQAVWDVDGKAGYNMGHPFQGETELVVSGDDPSTTLEDALDEVRDQLDTFRDAFEDA